MAWYKAKLSDGSEHRLWFGHDPTEADILASLKAPTMAEGVPLADQPDQPEVGVGGSPLQRAMGTEADPNSPEKLLKGAIFAASFPGGPAGTGTAAVARSVLGRAAQVAAKPSVVGGALAAGGAALEGASPKHIAYAGAVGAGLPMVPGVAKFANKALAAGLEKLVAKAAPEVDAALSARIAHTLTREAPAAVEAAGEALTASRMAPGASQAAKALEGAGLSPELATAEAGKMAGATGEVSGNLPGVMTPAGGTPALKMPAISLAEDIQAQVAKLRASGLSKPQITAAVREAHNLEPGAAGKVVDTIFEHSGPRPAATTEVIPAGSKVMPPYRGGKAQPSMGPARVPTSDADLSQLLKDSIAAYKIP